MKTESILNDFFFYLMYLIRIAANSVLLFRILELKEQESLLNLHKKSKTKICTTYCKILRIFSMITGSITFLKERSHIAA